MAVNQTAQVENFREFIRLIETWDVLKSTKGSLKDFKQTFNRNMGCIEMDIGSLLRMNTDEFNRNMGCIEIWGKEIYLK